MLLQEIHQYVKKTAAEFVERYVEPVSREIDRGLFPKELLRELGRLQMLAPHLPPEYGGAGLDFRSEVLIIEELAKSSPSLATVAEVQGAMAAYLLLHYGGEYVRERWLPQVGRGDRVLSFALSEPCCGSDISSIETRAERRGGEWVLNGVKTWITSGLYADGYIVAARTGPPGERRITLFLLERGSCIETSPIGVMGMRGTGTAEVKIDNCVVGDDEVLGGVDKGFGVALDVINNGRMSVGAIGLGIVERAYAEAYAYAERRRAFGTVLANIQAVQHQLAAILAQREALRWVVYATAYFKDVGDRQFPLYAQISKFLGSRLAVDATRAAMQIMGAYGYSTDSKIEMLYRDAKATEIYEGPNEVVLNTVFRLGKKLSE